MNNRIVGINKVIISGALLTVILIIGLYGYMSIRNRYPSRSLRKSFHHNMEDPTDHEVHIHLHANSNSPVSPNNDFFSSGITQHLADIQKDCKDYRDITIYPQNRNSHLPQKTICANHGETFHPSKDAKEPKRASLPTLPLISDFE